MKRASPTSADVNSVCALHHTRRAARAVTALYDEAIAPCGIRATQFSVLVAIEQMAGQPVTQIAEVLGMDRSTLTREMRTLEEAGLVKVAVGEDRRARHPALTVKGARTVKSALPMWAKAQEHLESRLGGERWRHVRSQLEAVALAAEPTD